MSVQAVPNSGPFNDPYLDDARQSALIAIDNNPTKLPTELIDYLIGLEQRHLDMIRRHKAEFLRESWQARRPAAEEDDR